MGKIIYDLVCTNPRCPYSEYSIGQSNHSGFSSDDPDARCPECGSPSTPRK